MARPLIPPLRPLPPPRPGLFRQTPPAIFVPIFGLFGLGLVWRRAELLFVLPPGFADAILGAVTLLYVFALAAYAAKAARRPGVIAEDLRVLPGRAGLTAASLSAMLLAATLVPHAPDLARAIVALALVLHAVLALTLAQTYLYGPPEARVVTPVWHLAFVGFIVACVALVPLGHTDLARAILYAMIPVAAVIWAASLWQFRAKIPPAPLRPLLAIHIAPATLFAIVAAFLGDQALGLAFSLLAAALLLVYLARARWITEAGFSPLWGAFTFPAASATQAFLLEPYAPFRLAGAAMLIVATVFIPWIAFRVMKLWAGGQLGPKTNAAIA